MKIEYAPKRGRGFVRPGETEKQQNRVFSGIKKAAPIRSRLSEQLTRCVVCECESKHKPTHDSLSLAGGQCVACSLSLGGYRFRDDFRRRGHLSKKPSIANLNEFCSDCNDSVGCCDFSGRRNSSSRLDCSSCCSIILRNVICLYSTKISKVDLSFVFIVLTCKAMRRSTSHHGADSDYSDSLALRRWRYSTSRFNAAVTNCPVLSPGIFTASTLFITSCGTLAATVCDFAFTAFVAILSTPHKKQMQYAGKKISVQHLTCLTPRFKLVFNTLLRQGVETTKPGSARTLTGLLTNNDSNSIEVAMRNHTQINPKFIYTFTALHRDRMADGVTTVHIAADTLVDARSMVKEMGYVAAFWKGRKENATTSRRSENKYIWRFIAFGTSDHQIIHVTAWTEREARNLCPSGCVAVFAARIRQGVSNV